METSSKCIFKKSIKKVWKKYQKKVSKKNQKKVSKKYIKRKYQKKISKEGIKKKYQKKVSKKVSIFSRLFYSPYGEQSYLQVNWKQKDFCQSKPVLSFLAIF